MQIRGDLGPRPEQKCKSCLPPTRKRWNLGGRRWPAQNRACEASKLAVLGLGDSKIGPNVAPKRLKVAPHKGFLTFGTPKIGLKTPLFVEGRGGGPERPETAQTQGTRALERN